MSRPRFQPVLAAISEEDEFAVPLTTHMAQKIFSPSHTNNNYWFYDGDDDVLITSANENVPMSELYAKKKQSNEECGLYNSDDDVLITSENENILMSELYAKEENNSCFSSALQLMNCIVSWVVNTLRSLFACLFPCCFFAPKTEVAAVTEETPLLAH